MIESERTAGWVAAPERLVVLPFQAESTGVPEAALELVGSRVLAALAESGRYEVISPVDVRIALERARGDARAVLVGAFAPDAFVCGRVRRFAGRANTGGAPLGPAHVAFQVWIEARDGERLWRGRYEERQRPLSEDITALRRAWSRGFRWVSPESLAAYGAGALVEELVRASDSQGGRRLAVPASPTRRDDPPRGASSEGPC